MGALYHLKQKLVDFCNVIQENVSRTDTVPSSKVVYDLKADSDSQISDLNDSLTNLYKIETFSVDYGEVGANSASRRIVTTIPQYDNYIPVMVIPTEVNNNRVITYYTAIQTRTVVGTQVQNMNGSAASITVQYRVLYLYKPE